MHLYHTTITKCTGITHAVHGNFSGTKQEEIIICRGQFLDLVRPGRNTGKVHTLLTAQVYCYIRALTTFRLAGSSKDYIIIGSNSGRIVILEYNPVKNCLEKVHQETFGKTGCSDTVPAQYLGIDPKGRAVMIGAVEKQKLAYIFSRDDQARLTISSPLEAHKPNTLTYDMVGVDVGFNNPIFACLEINYEDDNNDPSGEAAQLTQQTLTFYELDLGLNHLVCKYSEPLEEHTNFLISVPGGNDGPSGVLICSENYLTYKNLGDQHDIRCPIPRRRNDLDDPERDMEFICSATLRTKSMYFFLLQTEQGDIFKVTLETHDDVVSEIKLKYFDTVPPAVAMCVLKTGFLFVACEFGNHYLYQIAHLGDDDDEPEFSSAIPLEEGQTFAFAPRTLKNLVMVDELQSLSPIMKCNITDLANEDTPQLYVLCGRGPRSSLRVLRHGLEVSEMAVSELPVNINAVWTVKKRANEEYDAYIIVSFVNATLVLSIGETVEEVTDSGFLGTTPTLSCSGLGDDALVQVYPDGIRHICSDKRVNEWKAPGKKSITKCAVNQRQVVIALSGKELVYFEMDATGALCEYSKRSEMPSEITCMALGNVAGDEQRSLFLAVGLADNTVRIISLDRKDCMNPCSMQTLQSPAESLCFVEYNSDEDDENECVKTSSKGTIYLNIGLSNGVLLRTVLDPVSGDFADTLTRHLGSRPVKLFRIRIQGSEAVLAISNRTWISYYHQRRFYLIPLLCEKLEYASGFSSEQCNDGIVTTCTNTLRFLALENLGAVINQIFPLEFTPRAYVIHPDTGRMIIAETEHNAYTEEAKNARKYEMAEEMRVAAGDEERDLANEMANAFINETLPEDIFSAPKPGAGFWASQIRGIDPINGQNYFKIPLLQNEAIMSMAILKFNIAADGRYYLAVGVAKDLQLNPRIENSGFIYLYRIDATCSSLELVHRTEIDEVPGALCSFQGRLLAGCGRYLRIYDLGKKTLLKKCENNHIPNMIMSILTMGHRIFVFGIQESVFFVRYRRDENQLLIFADDTHQRWVTATALIDYDTVAIGDRFGNISVHRLQQSLKDDVDDENPTGTRPYLDGDLLSGASQKCENICLFNVGEKIMSLQKTIVISGGSKVLIYTTLSGSIGAFVPFKNLTDLNFFQTLEEYMRKENLSLCGSDHLSYRSSYLSVKNVIDGDLCEQYLSIDPAKQKSIAAGMRTTQREIYNKLDLFRNL